jgi:pSer/pThr/pTyr-binding forkhead associated (FHA) protein
MTLGLLVLSPGKWQGRVISLPRPMFLIGRDPHCHLRPASSSVDDRHCAVICREGAFYLCDLESRNGTYLNGERISGQVQLADTDLIRVGTIELAVQLEARTPSASETDPNIVLGKDDGTVLDTLALPEPRRDRSGRRRSTSEAASNLLAEYLKK